MVGHFVFKNLHWKSNVIWLSCITSDFQNALIHSNPLGNKKKVIKQFSNPVRFNLIPASSSIFKTYGNQKWNSFSSSISSNLSRINCPDPDTESQKSFDLIFDNSLAISALL